MQKVIAYLILPSLLLVVMAFTPVAKEKVHWLTVAEAQVAYAKNPKPILVDVYTSWCGWCKVMDKETYGNEKIVAYLNQHYYAIKLDAERRDSVIWNGKKYGYNRRARVNELALYLTNGQISFPTTVFLTALNAQPLPLLGYLKAKEIAAPLNYFGEGAYKTQSFPEFNKNFSPENWIASLTK